MLMDTSAAFGCSIHCASSFWWRNLTLVSGVKIAKGTGSWGHSSSAEINGSFSVLHTMSQPRRLKVFADWLFRGSNKGSECDPSQEHSESVNEDILMFFFELDLATRVQYALNLEQYDIAQQLRNKLTEVESEVMKLRDVRRGTTSKSEAQDTAIKILRLRADLQNAVEREEYNTAAALRDEISKLEAKSLAASLKAQAFTDAQYAFRLGQKVKHKKFGYQAVICGMDPVCCESKTWMDRANVANLARGPDQPFYQVGPSRLCVTVNIVLEELQPFSPSLCLRVLVDVQEDPNLLVAYVAEENIVAPEEQDRFQRRFDHPYASFLFYGVDASGDYIPIKHLRQKYNQPRNELPYDHDPPDG